MNFLKESLKNLKAPDPFWLYKVGTSLIKQNAEKRSEASGDSTVIETGAILSSIEDCIKNPHRIPYTETPLEPLIQAIAKEAVEFAEVFNCHKKDYRHYRQNGGERNYREYIHDTVALDVLNAYRNSGLMLHLANTQAITTEQLQIAGTGVVRSLDKHGANGLLAMWQYWDKDKGSLLRRLAEDERQIVPKTVQSTPNAHARPYSRKDFLAIEMKHAKIEHDAEIESVLQKVIPRTLGPAYQEALEAKETLIAQHITSGQHKADNNFFTGVSALHPRNKRARNATKIVKSSSYLYQDKSLELSPAELENIRIGNPPKSFHEMLDAVLGSAHPDKAIAREGLLKLTDRSVKPDTAPNDAEINPFALLEDGTKKESAAEDTSAPLEEKKVFTEKKDKETPSTSSSKPSDKQLHHADNKENSAKPSNIGAATATLGGAAAMAGLLLSGHKKTPLDDQSADAGQVRSVESKKHSLKPLAFASAATVTVGGAIMWSKQPKALYEPLKDLLGKLVGRSSRI